MKDKQELQQQRDLVFEELQETRKQVIESVTDTTDEDYDIFGKTEKLIQRVRQLLDELIQLDDMIETM